MRKIKLRKTLMIIFSVCTVMLICGVCNYVMESGSGTENINLGSEYENADTIPGRVRGRLINMSNCQNIILSGLKLYEGPCWNIHMIYSDNNISNDIYTV